jgi:hypothetical protein
MQPAAPLDYRETLEVLADWAGREVLVISRVTWPAPVPDCQVTLRGVLGEVQMVDNEIDRTVQSVAAFAVGDAAGGVYLSAGDFVHTVRLARGHVNIKFEHDLHIEVRIA